MSKAICAEPLREAPPPSEGMEGQFRRWSAASKGQVRQDKFLEPLKAQFRRNSRQHAHFAIFAPQRRGACLESGSGARIL